MDSLELRFFTGVW